MTELLTPLITYQLRDFIIFTTHFLIVNNLLLPSLYKYYLLYKKKPHSLLCDNVEKGNNNTT